MIQTGVRAAVKAVVADALPDKCLQRIRADRYADDEGNEQLHVNVQYSANHSDLDIDVVLDSTVSLGNAQSIMDDMSIHEFGNSFCGIRQSGLLGDFQGPVLFLDGIKCRWPKCPPQAIR